MVFDNQVEGFAALLESYADPSTIPTDVTEDLARGLIRKHFGDTPDPLPRWADVKGLLDAKRKGCEVHSYTFEEKNAFDPMTIAKAVASGNMTMQQEEAHVQGIWSSKPACRSVYRDDYQAFLEDVSREKIMLVNAPKPELAPEVEKVVPKEAPRPWPSDQAGYSLVALRDSVSSVAKHFPHGTPLIGDLHWSSRALSRTWGFCRHSDKSITLNCVLNSPDVPLFVVEFLMFHEMLHADMPSAGHNKDFRLRERGYSPSAEALEDAVSRGIRPGAKASPDFWRVRADMFFDTFTRYYAHKRPGTVMGL